MKTSNYILMFFVLTILTNCSRKTDELKQTVNAVIGDISYVQTFGYQPNKETDENTRIQTHLKFVESLLRNKDISSWSRQRSRTFGSEYSVMPPNNPVRNT